jgi:hypothetical protein
MAAVLASMPGAEVCPASDMQTAGATCRHHPRALIDDDTTAVSTLRVAWMPTSRTMVRWGLLWTSRLASRWLQVRGAGRD